MLYIILSIIILPIIISLYILELNGWLRCADDKGLEKRIFYSLIIGLNILILIIGYLVWQSLGLPENSDNEKFKRALNKVSLFLGLFLSIVELLIMFLHDKTDASSTKSRKIDSLLCFFLGYFGAHRIYEKKIVSGVLRLIGSLVSIIIPIVLDNMNNKDILLYARFPVDKKIFVAYERFPVIVVLCIILLYVLSIWEFIDMILILYGDSCDADGNKITRWNSVEALKAKGIELKDEKIGRRADNLKPVISGPFKIFCLGSYIAIPVILIVGFVEKIIS